MKILRFSPVAVIISFMLLTGCTVKKNSAVNPDSAKVNLIPCDGNTPLLLWVKQQTAGWSPKAISIAVQDTATQMLYLTIAHATFFENSSANQSYGLNGEYTDQLNKTFKDVKQFWDIHSDDIIMIAKHGSMLRDRDKVFLTYKKVYGYIAVS